MRAISVVLMLAAPLALAQPRHDSTAAQPDASGALPGDDALTCEQLQAQLNSIAADPALQGVIAQQQALAGGAANQVAQHPDAARGNEGQLRQAAAGAGANGAAASPDQANAQAAEPPKNEQPEHGRKKRGLFKALGGGIAGGFGADRAAQAAQQRQIEAMGKAGREAQAANKAALDAQAAQVSGMSPQMMRGMHLMQIAQAKGCAAEQSGSGH